MIETTAVIMFICLLPTIAVGAMFIFFILKPKDKFTNRVSHLRLVWLALAYPSEFSELQRQHLDYPDYYQTAFPWLTKNVHKNIGEK